MEIDAEPDRQLAESEQLIMIPSALRQLLCFLSGFGYQLHSLNNFISSLEGLPGHAVLKPCQMQTSASSSPFFEQRHSLKRIYDAENLCLLRASDCNL